MPTEALGLEFQEETRADIGDVAWVDAAIRRAKSQTDEFTKELATMQKPMLLPSEKGRGTAIFDHFDVDGSGAIGVDEVLLGVKAFGVDVDEDEVRALFDAADVNGSGGIDQHEFAHLVEGVAMLRAGRTREVERLAAAAKTLHAQALSDPLTLVAEGELPTLLKCAASGHAAVEQLGMTALAAVAEAPQADCAAAIASRAQLAGVLAALNKPDKPFASLRAGARLLAALCREASEAKEVEARRKTRMRIYESAAPLLCGLFAKRCVGADDELPGQCLALVLSAFASEAPLVTRLATDGGGAALALACRLAGSADPTTRAASVDAIGEAAAVDEGAHAWRLVGFGAIEPLLLAAAVPPSPQEPYVAEVATRTLAALNYEGLWRGVHGADVMAGQHPVHEVPAV